MGEISSIDDLLMGVGNSQQPATPEHKEKIQEEKEDIEELEPDEPEPEHEDSEPDSEEPEQEEKEESDEPEEKPEPKEDDDVDEYGNKKERMSKGMKERLERKEKQHQREIEQRDLELQQLRQQLASQGATPQVQQAVKDFKYDESNEEVSWEQQLSNFVKHTVVNMNSEQQQVERKAQEQLVQREFEQKFINGMERFKDFREVVGAQPMDDAMTLALRGMSDPSAFIYAASKRQPQEIERISKLKDPYARMVEMGKLEERMRRNKPSTKAPRPLGRTREDATTKVVAKQKDTSGDDLLAKADAKRLSTVRARHKSNR